MEMWHCFESECVANFVVQFFVLSVCSFGKDESPQHLRGRISHGGAEHTEGVVDFLREPCDSVRSNADVLAANPKVCVFMLLDRSWALMVERQAG